MTIIVIVKALILTPKGGENRGKTKIDELLEQASGKQISS